jgi:transposase
MNRFHHDIKDITLVFDKGNLSAEAFKNFKGLDVQFVASLRPSTQKDLLEFPLYLFTPVVLQPSGKKIWYYPVRRAIYDVERDVYVVFDPRHFKKSKKQLLTHATSAMKEVEDYFKDRLNGNKWREKDNVDEKIQELLGKSLYDSIVKVNVTGKSGSISFNMTLDREVVSHAAQVSSTSLLFTTREDWDAGTVIQTYREQHVIEDAFKHLKSPQHVAIRPIFHHVDSSIRVHVFICVISLILLAITRLRLYQANIQITYPELLKTLNHINLTRMQIPGSKKHHDALNKLDKKESRVVSALNLKTWIKK